MDIITYALAKKAQNTANTAIGMIKELPKGLTFKGTVQYEKDLPLDSEIGDCYIVEYTGTSGVNLNGQLYIKTQDKWIKNSEVIIDQIFNKESENAQSGIAINEVLAKKQDKFAEISDGGSGGIHTDIDFSTSSVTFYPLADHSNSSYIDINPMRITLSGSKDKDYGGVILNCHLNANNNFIKNVQSPKEDGDAANKQYVDSSIPVIDQVFSALSSNAQSGLAVNEAVSYGVAEAKRYTYEHIDQVFDEESENAQSGVALSSEFDKKVDKTITINNQPLSKNITITASDIGAEIAGTAGNLISQHNSLDNSHKTLFDKKQDIIEDLENIRSNSQTAYNHTLNKNNPHEISYDKLGLIQEQNLSESIQEKLNKEVLPPVLSQDLTTQVKVGFVEQGTTFTKGTSLEEIIKQIFLNNTPSSLYLYSGVNATRMTNITSDWTQINIPDDFATNGIDVRIITNDGQFEHFAYPSSYGLLQHIYQSGQSVLENFQYTTTVYNNTEYYIYSTTLEQYDDDSIYSFKFQ